MRSGSYDVPLHMYNLDMYKRDRVPDFLGDFNTLLRNALRSQPMNNHLSFFSGLSEGLHEGFTKGKELGSEQATEASIRSFMTAGKSQVMVTKEGDIYPFGNMKELYENEKYAEYIRKYLGSDKPIQEIIQPLETKLKKAMSKKKNFGEVQREDYTSDIVKISNDLANLQKEVKSHGNMITSEEDFAEYVSQRKQKMDLLDKEMEFIEEMKDKDIIKLTEAEFKANIKKHDDMGLEKDQLQKEIVDKQNAYTDALKIEEEKQSLIEKIEDLSKQKSFFEEKQKGIDIKLKKSLNRDADKELNILFDKFGEISQKKPTTLFDLDKYNKTLFKKNEESILESTKDREEAQNNLLEVKTKHDALVVKIDTASTNIETLKKKLNNERHEKKKETIQTNISEAIEKKTKQERNLQTITKNMKTFTDNISTATKKIEKAKEDIVKSEEITKLISKYEKREKDAEYAKLNTKINALNKEITGFKSGDTNFSTIEAPSLSRYFRSDKKGETPIFKADDFSIYKVNNIRNIVKNEGIENLSLSETLKKAFSIKPTEAIITDKRTKPLPFETMVESIEIPKNLKTYEPNKYLITKYLSNEAYTGDKDLTTYVNNLTNRSNF